MALGDLYFDVLLNDKTDQGINAIKSKLSNLVANVDIKPSTTDINVTASLAIDRNKLITDVQDALKSKQFTIDIKATSNITTNANKSTLAYETEAQAKLIGAQARLLNAQNAQAVASAKAALAQAKLATEHQKTAREANRAQIEATKLARQKQMLANATNRATQSARNYTNANRGVIGSLREMAGLAGKFSAIYMGGQFLSSLIRIRGEFEMQLVSLRAILQSTERANELYGQLQQLSVISPFQFGDLVKYAKQLSAYQIPTQDLYDTTKRLADLSAGLGVDMNRLILAYGQVKSAAVLRGTELRQFTEAGLPMVSALADKFSELEGRVVATGEVFDKISNREVPFQMVKEVLEDLTSEGGIFFEMQEKQAQTLQGQISNLKDAYAIMLNEIGQSTDGILKGGVGAIRWSLQNYEELLNILMSVVAAYGAYRIQLGYKTSIMGKDTQATLTNALAEKKLEATRLKSVMLTRTLTPAENRIINTRHKLTYVDYELMVAEGKLNAAQVKNLFLAGKITKGQFELLAASAGMQKNYIASIANMTTMQRVGERLKLSLAGVGRAFKALGATMKAAWPMLVIGLITELIMQFSRLGDEQKRINKEIAENAKMLVSDLSSFFNSHKIAINNIGVGEMSTDEARKFVEKAFEKIEQSAPSGVASIKAEILMEEDDIAQAEKAMEILTSMRNVAEQFSTGAIQWDIPEYFIEEGLADDIADLASEAKEAQKALAGFGLTWEQFFANGVKGAKGEGSTLALERYKNRLIEVKREVTELVDANISEFTGKSVEEQKRMYESLFAEVEKMMNDAGLGLEPQSHITGIFDSLMNENISGLQYYAASYSKIIDGLSDKDKKEIRSWAGVINEERRKVLTRMLEDARSKLGGIGISAKQLADDISKLEPILNIKLNIDNKKQTSSVQDAISKAFGRSAVRTPGQARVEKLFEGMTDFSLVEEKIQKEWARTEKSIKSLEKLGNLSKEQQTQLKNAKEVKSSFELLAATLGVSYIEPTTKGEKSQVDQVAKALQDQYKELKKVYDEWEKLSKIIGNENAKAELAKMSGFKELFEDANLADLINKMLTKGGDLELVKEYLEKVKGMTSKEALSLVETLEQALRSIQTKDLTESVEKAVERINDALDVNIKKYQEWEKYYESTGNKSIASLLAYGDANAIAKSDVELKKDNVGSVANKLGGEYKYLTYSILLTYDKDKLDELPKVLQESFKEAQDAVDSEASEINAKLIESYINTMSIDEQIKALEEVRDKLLQSTTDATLKKSVIDDYAKKIGELKAKALELLPVWERIFGDSFSYGGIKEAMGYAKQLIENATPTTKNADGTMSYMSSFIDANGVKQEVAIVSDQLKDLKKQYGELFDSLAEKNPFKAFVASMRELTSESRSLSNDRAWRGVLNSLSGIFKMGAELSGSMKTIFDATGLENVGNAMNTAMILLEGTSNIAQAYAQGDDMGAMVASAQLLANTIADAKWRSSADEEEAIEELEGKIRGYQSAREMLENSLRRELGIYGEDGVKSMEKYAEMVKTYEEEIAAREAQLAEEKNKKESDQDATAIADYEAEIDKLNETVRYFAEDTLKDLMGIDLKEWANNFGDALVEAFASGEDAAGAFDKTVADLMKNVVKNMASLYILEPALKELQTYLFGTDGNGGVFGSDRHFSEEDLAGMKPYLDRLEKETIPAVEDLFEAIDTAMGGVLSSSSNLEGLSGGIKSITEDTANLLASYLNAVRADVALIAMGSPRMTTIAEAQLAQLNVIATNTSRSAVAVEAINTLLKSVTTTTSSGRVLKV